LCCIDRWKPPPSPVAYVWTVVNTPTFIGGLMRNQACPPRHPVRCLA
jgi:hypothetical protein